MNMNTTAVDAICTSSATFIPPVTTIAAVSISVSVLVSSSAIFRKSAAFAHVKEVSMSWASARRG
jgi:hypothetical protein